MRHNEHKRIKHRQEPGDLPKQIKIKMREKKVPLEIFPWQIISPSAAKTFRKIIQERGKTVQRRRNKKEIEDQLD